MSERKALIDLVERADSVVLRLCDDPNEYSDLEKHDALNRLADSVARARSALLLSNTGGKENG